MDFSAFFASLITLIVLDIHSLDFCDGFEHIEIKPAEVKVNVGEEIQVDCYTRANIRQWFKLQWQALDGSRNFQQFQHGPTATLSIKEAQIRHSGSYMCLYKDNTGKTSNKTLMIIVVDDGVTDPVLREVTDADEDQMIWLKTTVIIVIACTVGIVLLISVVVIAIFRIKMKRAAVRRAMRQADRRRRHANRCENQTSNSHHRSSRARRNDSHEQEPFISAPSPTHFGNIIVNVNNGVQYVPSSEFSSVLQSPPSYAEVVAETGVVIVGRNSPPPEYSTIDRNPNRLSDGSMSASQSCNQNLADTQISTSACCDHMATQRDRQNVGENHETPVCLHDIQVIPCGNDTLNNRSADPPHTLQYNSAGVVTETNSLGRRSHSGRLSRNVRSVGSPRRPKQLKVQDGQIVLDESSSNSSSPDTINRNTQTNAADIESAAKSESAAKPAQLQVQDGQIILAGEETADTSSASTTEQHNTADSDGAISSQGQLEVKDGQIVFKTSGGT